MLHDLTGQMIGHYQIMRPIEQGGMATVYLARDIHLQRQVAIKVFQFAQDQERTQEFFYRFTREAQVVARLDHPNIVLVHDYGEQDNLAYLIMPYFAQGSLKQWLQARGRLPIADALRFSAQLLNALQYAHDRGLIHRDIKPGNILFKDDQTAVLADFGLVKETVAGNTDEIMAINAQGTHQPVLTNGAVMGTPYYMAPEQIHGHAQSQSDIYSIGLVLYEMLTGRLPFVKSPTDGLINVLLKQANDPPIPIAELNSGISSQLEAAIMCSLEKDVTRRYQRPSEFLEALYLASQQNLISISTRTMDVSRAHPDDKKDDQDLDATVPLFSLQSSLSVSSAPKASSSSEPAHMTTDPALYQKSRHTTSRRRRGYLLYGVLVVILLLALVFASPYLLAYVNRGVTRNSGRAVKSPAATPQKQSVVTSPMPPTQTSCPADGKARAAVMRSYGTQGNNIVVYAASTSSSGTSALMSYNPLTGKTKSIITLPSMLTDVQLSANGQWVIFFTYNTNPGSVSQLQMVRIDGQGLQTLYCSSSAPSDLLASPGLNPTQPWSLFFMENSTGNSATLFVLDIPTGTLVQKSAASHSYSPISWSNDEELYLHESHESGSLDGGMQYSVVQLTIHPGQGGSEPTILSEMDVSTLCSDVSFSTDNSTMYTSQCTGQGGNIGASGLVPSQGPSALARAKLDVAADQWGKAIVYYTHPTLAIVQIRAVTSTRLLLVVRNDDMYANQNGLWEMNTNGLGLQRLYTDTSEVTLLNTSSQYPWSNVSGDGDNYAFKVGSTQSLGYDQLLVGSLSGGVPKVIVQDGTEGIDHMAVLNIVGWTTV